MKIKKMIVFFVLLYAGPLLSSQDQSQGKDFSHISSEDMQVMPDIPLVSKALAQEYLANDGQEFLNYLKEHEESKDLHDSYCRWIENILDNDKRRFFSQQYDNDINELSAKAVAELTGQQRNFIFAKALELRCDNEEYKQKVKKLRESNKKLLEQLKQKDEQLESQSKKSQKVGVRSTKKREKGITASLDNIKELLK